MKKIFGLSLMVGVLFLSGCAISHTYGPYMGKVVEKGTGEPIEGAVVFMQFYTSSGNIGGMTKQYVDSVETLTNAKGEYLIPLHRVTTFRTFEAWYKDAYAIIFKPGYGAFPGNREATLSDPSRILHANKPVVVELPRLNTKEIRIDNLDNIRRYSMDEVPCEKQRNILRLYKFERIYLGLDYRNSCQGEDNNEK